VARWEGALDQELLQQQIGRRALHTVETPT
jgi:hypothetical protein